MLQEGGSKSDAYKPYVRANDARCGVLSEDTADKRRAGIGNLGRATIEGVSNDSTQGATHDAEVRVVCANEHVMYIGVSGVVTSAIVYGDTKATERSLAWSRSDDGRDRNRVEIVCYISTGGSCLHGWIAVCDFVNVGEAGVIPTSASVRVEAGAIALSAISRRESTVGYVGSHTISEWVIHEVLPTPASPLTLGGGGEEGGSA